MHSYWYLHWSIRGCNLISIKLRSFNKNVERQIIVRKNRRRRDRDTETESESGRERERERERDLNRVRGEYLYQGEKEDKKSNSKEN